MKSIAKAKNTTQPLDWWEAFQNAARKDGKTLSAWMGDICVEKLPKRVQASLSERPEAHRPKGENNE